MPTIDCRVYDDRALLMLEDPTAYAERAREESLALVKRELGERREQALRSR